MNEFVSLIGAEDVKSAGYRMKAAAEEITQALSFSSEELRRATEIMQQLVEQLAELNKEKES